MSSLNEPSNNELVVLLKSDDVAHILNISRSMAYLLMERGDIPTVHISRAVRVRPKDLEQYIQANISSS
jgi:predicted DNA-binding transcriptional regulator AlpA